MYNPRKGEVHYQQLWSLIETMAQRFIDIDKSAMLKLIEKSTTGKIKDFEKEYNEIMDALYREKIKEVINDLDRCVEK